MQLARDLATPRASREQLSARARLQAASERVNERTPLAQLASISRARACCLQLTQAKQARAPMTPISRTVANSDVSQRRARSRSLARSVLARAATISQSSSSPFGCKQRRRWRRWRWRQHRPVKRDVWERRLFFTKSDGRNYAQARARIDCRRPKRQHRRRRRRCRCRRRRRCRCRRFSVRKRERRRWRCAAAIMRALVSAARATAPRM